MGLRCKTCIITNSCRPMYHCIFQFQLKLECILPHLSRIPSPKINPKESPFRTECSFYRVQFLGTFDLQRSRWLIRELFMLIVLIYFTPHSPEQITLMLLTHITSHKHIASSLGQLTNH